jgi:uncharacterized protein Usg
MAFPKFRISLPGKYKLTCAFIGYKIFDKDLLVEENKTIIIDFNLATDFPTIGCPVIKTETNPIILQRE